MRRRGCLAHGSSAPREGRGGRAAAPCAAAERTRESVEGTIPSHRLTLIARSSARGPASRTGQPRPTARRDETLHGPRIDHASPAGHDAPGKARREVVRIGRCRGGVALKTFRNGVFGARGGIAEGGRGRGAPRESGLRTVDPTGQRRRASRQRDAGGHSRG